MKKYTKRLAATKGCNTCQWENPENVVIGEKCLNPKTKGHGFFGCMQTDRNNKCFYEHWEPSIGYIEKKDW